MNLKWTLGAAVIVAASLSSIATTPATAAPPNILVIFGDDVGQTNVSAYTQGLVGYRTPNIDRIAHEGMLFTDYYAENSCTAGRSTFITGQTAWRTGMSKVGIPGAPVGIQDRDVTIAQALKPLGYATGQFGKNHLGDQDRFLPTRHGFDEFFGNLYHLNAEEEPERPYWPKDNPGSGYDQWRTENAYLAAEAVIRAAKFLQTFVDYPPSQPPASFSIDQIVEDVKAKIAEKMKAQAPAQ